MKRLLIIVVFASLAVLSGCDTSPKSPRGFSLPEGDPKVGQAVFVELQCNACHQIPGVEQLQSAVGEPQISVKLGGKVSKIKTYGELVTSVINPSHRLVKGYPADKIQSDGESKMRNYNDMMTVRQLIDLVAFLQSKYDLLIYDPTRYRSYKL